MHIKPIGERVLLKPAKGEERTKSGLYLPETTESKKEGEVIAVGTFEDGKPLPLQRGDHVLYGGYTHDEFEIDGAKVVIVEFKDVLAKVEKHHDGK
jgi:chaperonin GroES